MSEEKRAPTFENALMDALELEKVLIETEGELSPDLEAALETVAQMVHEKTDGVAFFIERTVKSEEHLKEIAKRMTEKAKRIEAYRDRLKEHIKSVMLAAGKTEVTGNIWSLKVQKTVPALILDEDFELKCDAKYLRTKTITTVDRTLVRDDLKEGLEVSGAKLQEQKALRAVIASAPKGRIEQ